MKRTSLVAVMSLVALTMLWAAQDASKPLYFAGYLVEVNPAKQTFAIRSHGKILVFKVDIKRCWITQDGSVTRRNLGWAKIGDAVMGKLSMAESQRYVRWVEFTRKPKPGRPVADKPSFLTTPYGPIWGVTGKFAAPVDARNLSPGDMIFDRGSGKIFLVP